MRWLLAGSVGMTVGAVVAGLWWMRPIRVEHFAAVQELRQDGVFVPFCVPTWLPNSASDIDVFWYPETAGFGRVAFRYKPGDLQPPDTACSTTVVDPEAIPGTRSLLASRKCSREVSKIVESPKPLLMFRCKADLQYRGGGTRRFTGYLIAGDSQGRAIYWTE
jgi:hypothetical protein